jgi:hypothetical protein
MNMASKGMRERVCVYVCACSCIIHQPWTFFHDPSVFALCPSHLGTAHISYIKGVMALTNSANIKHAAKNNYKSSKCSRSCCCFACFNVVFARCYSFFMGAWCYSCSYRVTCAYASSFHQFSFCNTSYEDSDATKLSTYLLQVHFTLLAYSLCPLNPSIKFKITWLPWTISFWSNLLPNYIFFASLYISWILSSNFVSR